MASQSTEYFFKESFKARDPNHSFRKNIHNHALTMCCHSFRTRLYIRLILLFSSLNDMKTAAASSAVESVLEKTLVHFTSFPLPSVFLCQAFLTVALRAPLWQIMYSHNTMPTPLCKFYDQYCILLSLPGLDYPSCTCCPPYYYSAPEQGHKKHGLN